MTVDEIYNRLASAGIARESCLEVDGPGEVLIMTPLGDVRNHHKSGTTCAFGEEICAVVLPPSLVKGLFHDHSGLDPNGVWDWVFQKAGPLYTNSPLPDLVEGIAFARALTSAGVRVISAEFFPNGIRFLCQRDPAAPPMPLWFEFGV